jgi:hypothetical protein
LDAYGGLNSGAYAVLSSGLTLDFWWTPLAAGTPQWQSPATGAFRDVSQGGTDTADGSVTATYIQPTVVMRLFEIDSNGPYATYLRGGSICLTSMQIDRWNLDSMTTISNDYSIGAGTGTPFAEAATNGNVDSGNVTTTYGQVGSWTVVYNADGSITMTPSAAVAALPNGLGLQYVTPQVGTNLPSNYAGGQPDAYYAGLLKDYPITWKPNTLYQIQADIATTDANNPPDYLVLGAGEWTNEADMISFVGNTGGDYNGGNVTKGPGALTATKATYMAFWYSNMTTLANQVIGGVNHVTPALKTWQPYFYVTETAAAVGRSAGNRTGGVTLSRLAVNEVTFP